MASKTSHICIALFSIGGAYAVGSESKIDFAHDVVPVLKQYCVECHGGKESKGGFSLNTRELILDAQVVVPRDAALSRLVELITSTDPDDQMPPKDRPRLPAGKIATLRGWIDQGLAWEAGFSFAQRRYEPPLLPRRPELPAAVDGRENPVDRIVDAYRRQHELPPSVGVSDAAFARRVHLDIVGLLPEPEELESFVADPSGDKRERLVRRLLDDDDAYAEHWLTFWNDLLRNDYTGTGFITGGRKQITTWLYRSLIENKPYDRFVRELIAPAEEAEGFIRGIRWRGNVSASQTQEIQFAQNITQAFLGINMKCASCHDSFIDRWTLEETYGLAQIYGSEPLELHRCDKPTGKTATAAWIFPELGQVAPKAAQPERLEQLAALMTHPENGRFTRTIVNRIWHRLMGRGIVHPVDAMHTEPWSADLLDFLAVHLVDHGYDLKKTIELICRSRTYQSAIPPQPAIGDGGTYVFRGPLPRRMTAEQFVDAVWQITQAAPASYDAQVERSPKPMVRSSLVKSDVLMRSLGRPNRDQIVTMRPGELTTLEAIALANGQTLADAIAHGAGLAVTRHGQSSDGLVRWLYTFALSRHPAPGELELARQLLGETPDEQRVEDLIWAVLMLPEFQLVR